MINFTKCNRKVTDVNNDKSLKTYLHDIRNIKILTNNDLVKISNFEKDEILEILHTYNGVISFVHDVLNNDK